MWWIRAVPIVEKGAIGVWDATRIEQFAGEVTAGGRGRWGRVRRVRRQLVDGDAVEEVDEVGEVLGGGLAGLGVVEAGEFEEAGVGVEGGGGLD